MCPILGAFVGAAARTEHRAVTSLAGNWWIRTDPDSSGLAEGWASRPLETDLTLAVPGCIQSLDELSDSYPPSGGYHNTYLGTVWLERAFPLRGTATRRRYWLAFGGIAPAAHIWLNGHYVGYHGYGPVSSKWDVTDFVLGNAVNRVSVAIVEQELGLMGGLRFRDQNWSGLFRTVEIEASEAVHLESPLAVTDAARREVAFAVDIHNDSGETVDLGPVFSVKPWPAGPILAERKADAVRMAPGEQRTVACLLQLPRAPLWSVEAPNLLLATIALSSGRRELDAAAIRFGLRTLEATDNQLHLNGRPFMVHGVGQEYFSPTLSPLVDQAVIKERLSALKAYGYNFFRCHTYPATPEELAVADELGFLVASEISLVSNFSRTEPFDRGLRLLQSYLVQTRNHPSLGVISLGNEGSQVMVRDRQAQAEAVRGYRTARSTAPNTLAMIAFGLQGELPDLPNDIESPHLWSHDFRSGYSGLTRVPWRGLTSLAQSRPCVIHEFGKYGVWPDPAEQDTYPPHGYRFRFGDEARAALIATGLEHLEGQIIRNSRSLHRICTQTAIEQARRQPGIDGYVMWTAFRGGAQSSGFADDVGQHCNADPETYRTQCNAPLAVLIDRGFAGRTLSAGAQVEIGIYLSNFSDRPVAKARVDWQLLGGNAIDGEPRVVGSLEHVSCALGDNARVGTVRFDVPRVRVPIRSVLDARVSEAGTQRAHSRWVFWLFPSKSPPCTTPIVCEFRDPSAMHRLLAFAPNTIKIQDLDSIARGCHAWTGMDIAESVAHSDERVLVTDHWGEAADLVLSLGRTVVFIDTGHFPASWYVQAAHDGYGKSQSHTSFTSFRAGWDEGNIATVIESHAALGALRYDSFCGLHWYSMVQDARPLRTWAVAAGEAVLARTVIVRSVPKLKAPAVPRRPRSPRELAAAEVAPSRQVFTDDRAYLLEARVGAGRILVCSLRCFQDPAGRYILSQILKYANADPREDDGRRGRTRTQMVDGVHAG